MSLYGYSRDTTPQLKTIEANDHFFLLRHVKPIRQVSTVPAFKFDAGI